MSIVERAADKLRQTDPEPARSARGDEVGEAPRRDPQRDHIAEAGQRQTQRQTKQAPAEPGPKIAVDFAQLQRIGLMPPPAAEKMVSQEYQRIKRPLLMNTAGAGPAAGMGNGNRFMMASAIQGEGKTFSSLNLALSLARERDCSVVLVDGDVIKPSISRALGLEDKRGLTDILADQSISFSSIVFETNVPRLAVLPAGQRNDEATELLASQRMAWFMGELSRDPNRLAVFDSPPLLATSEAQALALAVGHVLLVVKAGSTERAAVDTALSLVTAPDQQVSLILNQTTKAHGDYYGSYYGGYYDGESASA